jgi:hypothetical protein
MATPQQRLIEVKTALTMMAHSVGAGLMDLARLRADHQALIEALTLDQPELVSRLDSLRSQAKYDATVNIYLQALGSLNQAVGKLQTIAFDPPS